MNTEILKEFIRCAIKEFMINDWNELMDVDAHEVTIAHRIAVYLEDKFKGYNIDLEYNRRGNEIKRDSTGRSIRPDIIIHKRRTNDNLCIFEIKKKSIDSEEANEDIKKLKDESKKFGYKLGVFIAIGSHRITLCWIRNPYEDIGLEYEELRG